VQGPVGCREDLGLDPEGRWEPWRVVDREGRDLTCF
jgi:hypothetical protein